jgi:hypothetical protein
MRNNSANFSFTSGNIGSEYVFPNVSGSVILDTASQNISNKNYSGGSITLTGSVIGSFGSFASGITSYGAAFTNSVTMGTNSITGIKDISASGNMTITGSIGTTGSISAGSFFGYGGALTGISATGGIPQGPIPYGSITAALPQGILPTGSIPSLVASYIPHGVIGAGSLTASIPQGLIPYGSLTAALPQGILPTGSIPTLNYIPQGQLITGSLPNTISVSGSVVAAYGSTSGDMNAIRFSTASGSTLIIGSMLTSNTVGQAGSFTHIFFNSDRAWRFMSTGTGANTDLVLKADVDGKNFVINNFLGSKQAMFAVATANPGFYTDGYGSFSGSVYGIAGRFGDVVTASSGSFTGSLRVGTTGQFGSTLNATGDILLGRVSTNRIAAYKGYSGHSSYHGGVTLLDLPNENPVVIYGYNSGSSSIVRFTSRSYTASTSEPWNAWANNVGYAQANGSWVFGAGSPAPSGIRFFVEGNGSFGSVYGYGGTLTGVTATAAPAGSNTAIQFNNAGTGSGDSNLTWNRTGSLLLVSGSVGINNNILQCALDVHGDTLVSGSIVGSYGLFDAVLCNDYVAATTVDSSFNYSMYHINSDYISTSGSMYGSYGSFADKVVAGSFVGYGGALTGITGGAGVGSAQVGVAGSVAVWSSGTAITNSLTSITGSGNISSLGSLTIGSKIRMMSGTGSWDLAIGTGSNQFNFISPANSTVLQLDNPSSGVTAQNVIATASYNGAIPLTAKGASGQTANLIEANVNGGATVFRVDASGNGSFAGSISTSGSVNTEYLLFNNGSWKGSFRGATLYTTNTYSQNFSGSPLAAGSMAFNAERILFKDWTANTAYGSLVTGSLHLTGDVNINGSFRGWGGTLTGVTATAAPAGSSTTIQYNNGGVGSGDSLLTWNQATDQLQTVNIDTTGSVHVGTNLLIENFLGIGVNPGDNLAKIGASTNTGSHAIRAYSSTATATASNPTVYIERNAPSGGSIYALYSTATGTGYKYAAWFDAGSVGIGTGSPDHKLTVDGNIRATGSFIGYGGQLTGVVAGGPTELYTYSVCGSGAGIATNKDLMDFFNNQSGSSVIIRDVRAYVRNTGTVTGISQQLEIYRTSAVGTGGVALSFDKTDTTNPTLSASITARLHPSGGATLIGQPIAGANIYTEEGTNSLMNFPIYNNYGNTNRQPLKLASGEGIKVRTGPTGGAGSISIIMTFTVS